MSPEFDWKEKINVLSEDSSPVSESDIALFADSNLPNRFFLQHLLQPESEPFCRKNYWRSFARILICRGIEQIQDVKKDLIVWLQDINWPGSMEIFKFILQNFSQFQDEIKKSIIEAVGTKDEQWFNTIWLMLYQKQKLSHVEISERIRYLEDIFESDNSKDIVSNLINVYFDSVIR